MRIGPPFITHQQGRHVLSANIEVKTSGVNCPESFWFASEGEESFFLPGMAALNTLYDGELKNVDDYLAQLLTSLDDQELKDNTVVILTGDHGEAIGDRGGFGHGARLWEVVLRVPFIVRDFR